MTIKFSGISQLPFPYTDLSSTKYWPAVAVSNVKEGGHIQSVFITTKQPSASIAPQTGNYINPALPFRSHVRPQRSISVNTKPDQFGRRPPYMPGCNYRISGKLTNSDIVMNNTFWIGVQPSLTLEMLEYAATSIENYFGLNF